MGILAGLQPQEALSSITHQLQMPWSTGEKCNLKSNQNKKDPASELHKNSEGATETFSGSEGQVKATISLPPPTS